MNTLTIKKGKEGGFVLTTELVLIVTILVLGLIVGMVSMRDALNAEMEDVAEAVGALDQGYAFDGIANLQNTASIAGSAWSDTADANAGDEQGFEFVASNGLELTANGVGANVEDAAAPGTISPGLN